MNTELNFLNFFLCTCKLCQHLQICSKYEIGLGGCKLTPIGMQLGKQIFFALKKLQFYRKQNFMQTPDYKHT